MLFRKKIGLFSEVDDMRKIVYDFRRRTGWLFENYRAVNYKKRANYDLEKLKAEDVEILEKLFTAHAVDAGNKDCLVERILGTVRDGMSYLDDQLLRHKDFYIRQGSNMAAHSADIEKILAFWRVKEAEMVKEHARTKEHWDKYCGYSQKGE